MVGLVKVASPKKIAAEIIVLKIGGVKILSDRLIFINFKMNKIKIKKKKVKKVSVNIIIDNQIPTGSIINNHATKSDTALFRVISRLILLPNTGKKPLMMICRMTKGKSELKIYKEEAIIAG